MWIISVNGKIVATLSDQYHIVEDEMAELYRDGAGI